MPDPTQVHVNRPLTDMAVAYAQSADAYFADRLAPLQGSPTRSNNYFKFTKDSWFRDELDRRAPGADANDVNYGLETPTFDTGTPWALRHPIDEQQIANQDEILDAEQDGMMLLMQLERIRRDRAFAATCLATSVWDKDVEGVNSSPTLGTSVLQWDDEASDPVGDIAYWKEERKKATGQDMNVLALGAEVWGWLKRHPDLLGRISGGSNNGSPAIVNKQIAAAVFEVDEVVVMDSIVNTAIHNAAFAGSFIGGKSALLMKRDPNAGKRGVTAVKTFTWEGYTGNKEGIRVLSYRKEPHTSYVEIESAFVHKVVAPDCGVFIRTLVP